MDEQMNEGAELHPQALRSMLEREREEKRGLADAVGRLMNSTKAAEAARDQYAAMYVETKKQLDELVNPKRKK